MLLLCNLAATTILPAIIRGMPPHWVNVPRQELAPAMMVVYGSFLPPSPPTKGSSFPGRCCDPLFSEFGGSATFKTFQDPMELLMLEMIEDR